jgi:hypothetical protein
MDGPSDTASTLHTEGPPAYGWVPEPASEDNLSVGPVEGEKLAELRKAGGWKRQARRGGWGRLCLIALAVLLLLGLIIGLAVGLTVGRRDNDRDDSQNNANNQAGSSSGDTDADLQFPLGQYTILTSLRNTTTACTSNPETWRCPPYTLGSTSTFQWIITNTSSTYAANTNGSRVLKTDEAGVPANLTISTSNNPLSITFSNVSMTYINPSTNTSAERYTFAVEQDKSVFPTVPLTGSQQSQCFFNQTTFTGTLYLRAERTLESENLPADIWPYAVDIEQVSPAGQDVPACYAWNNGMVGERITEGLVPQGEGSECVCGYSNF